MNKTNVKRLILIIAAVFFLTFGFYGGQYAISVLTLIMLYLSLGMMWNLLSGYTGLTSLGQQTFVGIGAYSLAIIAQKYGLPVPLCFVAAAGIAVVFALLISLPIFKMNGVYFTIGTWIIAEALGIWFSNWKFANYEIGFNVSAVYSISPKIIYFLSAVMGIGSIVLVVFLLKSGLGLKLQAIRDNMAAAEVRGIRIYRTKLLVFIIASVWAALTAVVIYMNQAYVIPSTSFGIDWTIAMMFIVIIGGSGTIEGPIIGAVLYIILKQLLYNFPGISNIILGAIAIAVILLAPKGIMGFINSRVNVNLFGIRRVMKD